MTEKQKMKSFEELSFTDNFIFTKIMEEHPSICIKITELVTGRKVRKMKGDKAKSEYGIKIAADSKGVRLDVYFEDNDSMYDIEMQTTQDGDLPKRFRYYQSTTDVGYLHAGDDYSELKKSIVVFLCTFDAFKKGLVRYEFQNLCVQDPAIALGDETYKIAVCSYGKK